jgi:hypothetical protein
VPDAPIESLNELLRALARERSLRGRLRVLGHSWTLLRSLSPAQREEVALRIGSKWAWKRVEKAFLADGSLSENERLVGQAFERMGDADPEELRNIARTLKEGDGRAAKDMLLQTLTEALEDEADEEEDEQLLEAERIDTSRDAEPASTINSPAEPVGEIVDSAAGVLASSLAHATDRPTPSGDGTAAVETPTPHTPTPKSATTPIRATQPKPAQVPRNEPYRRTALSTSDPDTPSVSASSVRGESPLQILRTLQLSERPGADLGRTGRAQLIDFLGGGWASRRALSRMIAARTLEGIDEALDLIRQIRSTSQQAWGLGDLLQHWDLDSVELDRVLAAAPTGAARRRLSARSRAKRASGRSDAG